MALGPEHTVVISTAYMPPLPHEAALRACNATHADAQSTEGRDSPCSLDESMVRTHATPQSYTHIHLSTWLFSFLPLHRPLPSLPLP